MANNISNAETRISDANKNRYCHSNVVKDYMSAPRHKKRVELIIACVKSYCKKGKALDIGASEVTMHALNAIGFKTTSLGLDNGVEGFKHVVADVQGDFSNNLSAFDLVLAGEIIEHVFDTRAFLRNIHRLMAEDGVLILSTPNLAGLTDRIRFVFGYSPRHVDPLHEYLWLHIRPFTLSKLLECLAASDLRVITLRTLPAELHVYGWRFNLPFINKVFPSLGANFIVVCKKHKV
jgi:SAM-dependent methyltransferase